LFLDNISTAISDKLVSGRRCVIDLKQSSSNWRLCSHESVESLSLLFRRCSSQTQAQLIAGETTRAQPGPDLTFTISSIETVYKNSQNPARLDDLYYKRNTSVKNEFLLSQT